MKPLDAGQQRELAFLRAQQSAEQKLGAANRWALAAGIAVAPALVVGLIALTAGGWRLALGLGLSTLVVMVALQVPRLLSPDKAAEWAVRASLPTEESMRRGGKNRGWPG
jgi:hypothetical protein